ncbi:MAG: S9 family peptidase [Vulcanimicrobiota bacterium]
MKKAILVFLLFLTTLASAQTEATTDLMTPELLWKLGRLGGVDVSADGKTAVYTVRNYELKENSGTTDLFVLDLASGNSRKLLESWASVGDVQFGRGPFGERIFIIGMQEKGEGHSPQAWAVNPQDGSLLKITALKDGIGNLKVSPTGTHIAFTRDIKLDKEVKEIYEDLPKSDARIIDKLMYRHWNAWHDYKYSHLHVASLGTNGKAGQAIDLMEGMKVDCPVPPFGGSQQYDWAPGGQQIAFTMKDVEKWAESTNSDVYLVDLADPKTHHNITKSNPGYDNNPTYSPDGKYLAYQSMARASFEADRNRIMVYDLSSKATTEATRGLDQTSHGATWLPDGSGLAFVSEQRGTEQIFQVNRSGSGLKQLSKGRYNWSLNAVLPNGKQALASFSSMERPHELALLNLANAQTRTLTHINDKIFAGLKLPKIEERWVEATDGQKIHNWVIYPPDFDPARKYPLLTYCQGGPQGQIGQSFSYRWNFHLMAANGYIVVAPNRRGLPGFGQKWNDDISGDWGGQAMQDILSSTDAMRKEPFVDNDKVAAIGASFGGYTVYWLMGHHQDRFATMIAHCGVFNLDSMYGTTEELFFVNWEMGGPYWKDAATQALYDKFSPHKFVGEWDTPLLVIHGEKDFRVPINQGLEAFTAAQVKDIPSRFLYFPEEGHWVLGPQNGIVWHRVFFEWLDRYCKEPDVTGDPEEE